MNFAGMLLVTVAVALPASAADRSLPVVDSSMSAAIYPKATQREEPKVTFAPAVVYPIELHSGIAGEVLVCVKVDESGLPVRLAILKSSQEVFGRYAIANAMQTMWKMDPAKKKSLTEGWFVRRIVFVRLE